MQFSGVKCVYIVPSPPLSISRTLPSFQTGVYLVLFPLNRNSPFPFLLVLVTSASLPILFTSCKWNHKIYFLCLAHFISITSVSFIHVVVYVRIPFLLKVEYSIIHTHTHTHIPQFVHSSVDGHLGSFHLLNTVNNAATSNSLSTNTCLSTCFQFLCVCTWIAITGSYGNSTFNFWGAANCFP